MPTLLLEIGTEELPASFVSSALDQWRARIPADLEAASLSYDQIQYWGTPRRLAVSITGLPSQQPDRVQEIKGPPASLAYVDGQLSKPALGFARKQGVDPSALELRETDKGSFLFAIQPIAGEPTAIVATNLSLGWITGLTGERLMRWGSGELKFPRPIRWLVALLDAQVLPLTLEGLTAGSLTYAHRVLHPDPVSLAEASLYAKALQAACVQVDIPTRQAQIKDGVEFIAQKAGGVAEIPEDLLAEVTQLVEWPTVVMGEFEADFLALPAPVIKTVMINHQRYFPVHQPGDPHTLLPHFITIANGDPAKSSIIAAGNSRVIRARLADARFFYDEDRRHPLETFLPKLDAVTFAEGLGSVGDKVRRIQSLATLISTALNFSPEEQALVARTATLAKADLVSQMVYEFPELQGMMGSDYARQAGEPSAVVAGLEQHYWPLGAGAALPIASTARIVGLADRLDTLVGLFRLGKKPTGSSDPFALRRAANALFLIMWDANWPLNWVDLLAQTFAVGSPTVTSGEPAAEVLPKLQEFLLQRLVTLLIEEGLDPDLVTAVIGDQDYLQTLALQNAVAARQKVQFLQDLRQAGQLDPLYPILNRLARIARQSDLSPDQRDPIAVVDPSLFNEPAEQQLFAAAQTIYTGSQRDLSTLAQSFLCSSPAIITFFEDVLVMVEDEKIRENRLNLLAVLHHNALILGDFSQIKM